MHRLEIARCFLFLRDIDFQGYCDIRDLNKFTCQWTLKGKSKAKNQGCPLHIVLRIPMTQFHEPTKVTEKTQNKGCDSCWWNKWHRWMNNTNSCFRSVKIKKAFLRHKCHNKDELMENGVWKALRRMDLIVSKFIRLMNIPRE